MRAPWLVAFPILLAVGRAGATIDMASVLERRDVALTIYNPRLTLVEEQRVLSLAKGTNRVSLNWTGAGLDPTTAYLEALQPQRAWRVTGLLSPITGDQLTWEIESAEPWSGVVRVLYSLSGFGWRAEYVAFADDAEKMLSLQATANITNQSGETFRNAQVRLVLGTPHLVSEAPVPRAPQAGRVADARAGATVEEAFGREAFSEYSLFTLKTRETLEVNQSRQVPLLASDRVRVDKAYIWDPRKYGSQVALVYEFRNSRENGLATPLPSGRVRVYRRTRDGDLALVGEDNLPSVPPDELATLFLGVAGNIVVERTLVDTRQENVQNSPDGQRRVSYDQVQDIKLVVRNRKAEEVEVRLFDPNAPGEVLSSSHKYERVDASTLKFIVRIPAGKEETLTYRLWQRIVT